MHVAEHSTKFFNTYGITLRILITFGTVEFILAHPGGRPV